MSKLCGNNFPAGMNPACQELLQRAKAALILKAGTKIPISQASNKSTYQRLLSEDLVAYFFEFTDFEPTVDDPEVQTDGFGRRATVREFSPSATTYAKVGACDYKEMLRAFKGDSADVIFVNENNVLHGWRDGDVFRGFSAELFAPQRGFAPNDAIHQYNRVDMNFRSVDEFNAFELIKPNFGLPTLAFTSAMPTGHDINLSSFDGTTAEVQIDLRCDEGVAGFVAADFVVVDSSSVSVIDTVTDNGGGSYTINLGAAIDADNFATIQLQKKSGDTVTDISQPLALQL